MSSKDPYQDDEGNWCCPRCGGARWTSKAQVHGHWRHCTPERPHMPGPELAAIVHAHTDPAARPARASARPADAGDELAQLRAELAELRKATGNHIGHLIAQGNTPWWRTPVGAVAAMMGTAGLAGLGLAAAADRTARRHQAQLAAQQECHRTHPEEPQQADVCVAKLMERYDRADAGGPSLPTGLAAGSLTAYAGKRMANKVIDKAAKRLLG